MHALIADHAQLYARQKLSLLNNSQIDLRDLNRTVEVFLLYCAHLAQQKRDRLAGAISFFFKGKEFRLSTDNEKEKGNWLCKLFILLYIY